MHFYQKPVETTFEKYNCLICAQDWRNFFSRFPWTWITKIKESHKCEKVKWMFDVGSKRTWNELPTRADFRGTDASVTNRFLRATLCNLSIHYYIHFIFIYEMLFICQIHQATHETELNIFHMIFINIYVLYSDITRMWTVLNHWTM